jgi:hypothetical protein
LQCIGFPIYLVELGLRAFCWAGAGQVDSNSSQFRDVTIPNSVTKLGLHSFSGCSELRTIVFPKDMAYLPEGTLYCCHQVISVILPDNLQIIGPRAFERCETLKCILLTKQIVRIGKSAFEYCRFLSNIGDSSNVRDFGDRAFFGCWTLPSIDMSGAEKIGKMVLRSCAHLEYVRLSRSFSRDNIPDQSDLSENRLKGCVFPVSAFHGIPDTCVIIIDECGIAIQDWLETIGTTITKIIPKKTYGDSWVTRALISGCIAVREDLFANNNVLRVVELPDVGTIGARAFSNCSRLELVTLSPVVHMKPRDGRYGQFDRCPLLHVVRFSYGKNTVIDLKAILLDQDSNESSALYAQIKEVHLELVDGCPLNEWLIDNCGKDGRVVQITYHPQVDGRSSVRLIEDDPEGVGRTIQTTYHPQAADHSFIKLIVNNMVTAQMIYRP